MPAHGHRPDAFTWQLHDPLRVLDLRRGNPPAASRRAASPASGQADAAPRVVLASRAADVALDAVASLLGKVSIDCVRLDADRLGSVRITADPSTCTLQVGRDRITPTVTWARHFEGRSIDPSPGGAHGLFLQDSWQALMAGLATVSRSFITSESPGVLAQLSLASRLGVAVPRTVVSNDPKSAKDIIRSPRVVVKALQSHFVEAKPGLLAGIFPEVMEQCCLDVPQQPPWPPVIVQEFVEHERELRVYFIGGETYSYSIAKTSPADIWLDSSLVTVLETDTPPEFAAAATRIATAMGLEYGAFDFLVKKGEPVFLEVNPDGDWSWIEDRTEQPTITRAVARMLRDLYISNLPAEIRKSGALGSLDLLRFLS
jgi:hypothetical protein